MRTRHHYLATDPFAYLDPRELGSIRMNHQLELLRIPQIRQLLSIKRWQQFNKSGQFAVSPKFDKAIWDGTVDYNIDMITESLSNIELLERAELLLRPLMSIDKVRSDSISEAKVLSIGPRTEYEILLLLSHGFKLENITGFDFFSYSPWIETGDMHDMPYGDDGYDIIILDWVLTYSHDPRRLTREVVRVAKTGAIVAVGVEYTPPFGNPYMKEEERITSCQQILEWFDRYVHHIYFQHEPELYWQNINDNILIIFDIAKNDSHSPKQQANQYDSQAAEKSYLLAHPDWQMGYDSIRHITKTFLKAFNSRDEVCLILWCPDEQNILNHEIYQKIRELIIELGYDPNDIPDIMIVRCPKSSLNDLLARIKFFIKCNMLEEIQVLDKVKEKGIEILALSDKSFITIRMRVLEQRMIDKVIYEFKDALRYCTNAVSIHEALENFRSGYEIFLRDGITPSRAYEGMRLLYCATNGMLNARLKEGYKDIYPVRMINTKSHIIEPIGNQRQEMICKSIQENGVHVFPEQIDATICESLKSFALNTPCSPYPRAQGLPETMLYERDRPVAPLYLFTDEEELIRLKAVQDLMIDRSILEIVQAYLGCEPILAAMVMWWSPVFSDRPSSEAAQLYHTDPDYLNFVKFFLYLTDVTAENGSHCYVRKSHKNKPKMLRRYDRMQDTEIGQYFNKEDIVEITGPAGTMFMADTQGIHKGNMLTKCDRLIFVMEFSTSLFGSEYKRVQLEEGFLSENFKEMLIRFPRIYSRYAVMGMEPLGSVGY